VPRTMRVGMVLRGLRGMVRGVHGVAMRDMRMMTRLLVVAFLVMFCRLAVMFGRVFVMLGGRFVMFGLGVAGHDDLPGSPRCGEAASEPCRGFVQEA
jgi:hypothetical protein